MGTNCIWGHAFHQGVLFKMCTEEHTFAPGLRPIRRCTDSIVLDPRLLRGILTSKIKLAIPSLPRLIEGSQYGMMIGRGHVPWVLPISTTYAHTLVYM